MPGQNILRKRLPYAQHNITLILIVLNLAVYLATLLIPDLQIYLSMVPILVNKGYIWQFVSYMFVHAGTTHILFNMIGLFIFGSQVEHQMGSWEFLMFYLVTGILAGIASYVVYILSGYDMVFLMGASGAVYAVLLAFATFYPDARIFIWGILPLRSVTLVLLYAAIAIFSQVSGRSGGVAHMTHLGGFVFAYLYFLIRLGINPIKYWGLRR